jgi:hypothetical protein
MITLISNLRNNDKVCLFCDGICLMTAVSLPIALPFLIIAMAAAQ